jgi:chorismate dehydratase
MRRGAHNRQPLRVGAPDRLETLPLVARLEHAAGPGRVALEFAPEDVLAERLAGRELDLALVGAHVPAGARGRYQLVPGMSVGGRGGPAAPRLEHRRPLAEVSTVASLVPGHAAEVLVAVLFAASGRTIEVRPAPGPAGEALRESDALLLAGDEAVLAPARPGGTLDLAAAWHELTGHPFVWSVWAAWPGHVDRATYALLHTARTRGRHALAHLVARRAPPGHDPAELEERLTRTLQYRLGSAQLAGLQALWDAAARHGLLPAGFRPAFLPLSAGTACHRLAR